MTDRPGQKAQEPHPFGYDDLIAFAAGQPELQGDAAIAAHLATCPACAATVDHYRLARDAVRADAALVPSPAAVARVRALAAGLRRPDAVAAPAAPLATLRRLVGTLVFDGWSQPKLAGLRGFGDGFVLAYATAGIEVDLEVVPELGSGGRRWQVMGQIAGSTGLAGAEVFLAAPSDDARIAHAKTDEEGIFTVQAETGRYDLHLRLPEGLLVLPDLHLEPSG